MPDESPAQFVNRLDRYLDDLAGKTLDQIAKRAGVAFKGIGSKEASVDVGADVAFSNWRPDTNSLATRFDVPRPGLVSFHPTRRSAGPWTVADRQFGTAERVVAEIEAKAPEIVEDEFRKTTRKFFD